MRMPAAFDVPAAAREETCRAGLNASACSAAAGQGMANMDIGPGTWGSLGDMTTLGQRGNSLLTDLDPARVCAHLSCCHCISLPEHCWAAPYSRIGRGKTQAWMLAECSL